jgi:hypothetical protein
MAVKLTKSQATNYRYFAGTLGVASAAMRYATPSAVVSIDLKNWTSGALAIGAVACVMAGWTKKGNVITEYLVPDQVRDW